MSGGYVFDTEAIIAFLYNEPGHEAVADLLDEVFTGDADGFLTETNATEVFSLVARFEGVDDMINSGSPRLQPCLLPITQRYRKKSTKFGLR